MTPTDDQRELRSLVERYAAAIDRRDKRALGELFLPDGGIDIYVPGRETPVAAFRGPEQLAGVIDAMHLYRMTTHFVGDFSATVEGDVADGVTHAVAHHWLAEDTEAPSHDEGLLLRYEDRFSRTPRGWRFSLRGIHRTWRKQPGRS